MVQIGKKIITMDNIFGYLILPDNKTAEYETKDLQISGKNGLYGRSLLFRNVQTNQEICSSITVVDKTSEKIAIARFNSPVSGKVYFRWLSTKNNHRQVLITTDLYRVADVEKLGKAATFTEHHWKIYVTDILEHKERSEQNCNILQLVFDPQNAGNDGAVGAIDVRLGKVKISTDNAKTRSKMFFVDEQLILLPSDLIGPQRRLYLVLFENKYPDSFLACAKIQYNQPINAK